MAGRPKGQPKTGGRQKGTLNKRTVELLAPQAAMEAGERVTSKGWLSKRLNDKTLDDAIRDKIAAVLLPFEYPRLSAIAVGSPDDAQRAEMLLAPRDAGKQVIFSLKALEHKITVQG